MALALFGHQRWISECPSWSAYPPILSVIADIGRQPGSAKTGREQLQQMASYSITSSASASSAGGTLRRSILAVCRLMTNSNLLDCITGKSAGFAPLRMRPV